MPVPAVLAKGALRRLAQSRSEPTPANFARAYAEEAAACGLAQAPDPVAVQVGGVDPRAGLAAGADPAAWPALVERLVRGLERGTAAWTLARRKESLQRVLTGSGGDAGRLQRRLAPLIAAWDSGAGDDQDDGAAVAPGTPVGIAVPPEPAAPAAAPAGRVAPDAAATQPPPSGSAAPRPSAPDWPAVVAPLLGALRDALAPDVPRAAALAGEIGALAQRLAAAGPAPPDPDLAQALMQAGVRAGWLLGHRRDLLPAVARLCGELADGLVDLAEEGSWARGQGEALKARLAEGLNVRNVHGAIELLAAARGRQAALRCERQAANEALKTLIHDLLGELGGLAAHTEHFEASVDRHARAIAAAGSLDDLGGAVGGLLAEAREAQALVRNARERLEADGTRAATLEQRVHALEGELRRLSDEVATDGLTRIANRRGLERAFALEVERAVHAADSGPAPAPLAVGLIDIDNFKRLNDSLGHAAGDEALRTLAAHVHDRLRAGDTVARFGGEEFVVLLPATPLEAARDMLTRLQRSLTESLFLHEGREVFVTFSAGVTAWRPGEALEAALARADEALYEAKRTGKNRTCAA